MTLAMVLVAGCGGGGGADLTGPVLDISQVTSIVLDQLYMNGGMEDEYGGRGEFSVYIRDAATGQDVACTTQEDGMDDLGSEGVYYGGLGVPFRKVEGVSVDSVARFKLMFVEKDAGACPEPIGPEDDLAGESRELTSDGLLDGMIWAQNGRAAAMLRPKSDGPMSVRSMAPAMTAGLYIDRLYFDYEAPDGQSPRFYIYAETQGGAQCQVSDASMSSIRAGKTLYAALGFQLPCLDGTDPEFPDIKARLALYAQEGSGPKLIGETEFACVGDLVGERAEFTNGDGYVTFRNISPEHFGAPVARLADLLATQITGLAFTAGRQTAGALEVHVIDPASGNTVACAGANQGLMGIGQPGDYDGLAASFVAAGWERELFGYASIRFELVERSDNLSCPALAKWDLPILAATGGLSPTDLKMGRASFEGSGGEIEFAASPAN